MIITNTSKSVISFFDFPGYFITISQDGYGKVLEIEIIETEILEHND